MKGEEWAGACARDACDYIGAIWWNDSTRRYYCKPCATRINAVNGSWLCRRAFRIAVVDDDRERLDLMVRQFASRGWPALAIDHPIGATSKTRAHGAHVLLVDYAMPLNGTAVVLVAKKHMPNLVAVIQSSADKATLEAAARESGADLWLSKSEDFDVALEKIRVLAERSAGVTVFDDRPESKVKR